jgi:hypothetical protein
MGQQAEDSHRVRRRERRRVSTHTAHTAQFGGRVATKPHFFLHAIRRR